MIDFSLNERVATINNDIDLIKQQIDILFDTNKMEVFGDRNFGTNYEDFLYDLSLPAETIQYQIESDLNTLQLFGYKPTVKVDLYQGTENDIILVRITLTNNNDTYEMTIKIS